jgi:phosphatidylglycerophosphate synthase
MNVPVGPSTYAALTMILGAVVAFIVAWAESGSAPVWLAGIAAGLTAVLSVSRSWQAVDQIKAEQPIFIEVDPVEISEG